MFRLIILLLPLFIFGCSDESDQGAPEEVISQPSPLVSAKPKMMMRGLPPQQMAIPVDQDKYAHSDENPTKSVETDPVSTFSIDVDTASYANTRRYLKDGILPPKDSVRIEEMVNYFDYDYTLPTTKEQPFQPTIEVFPTPWNADTKLIHIGIKGYEIQKKTSPRANLVFLLDTSGSMYSEDKLPLLQRSLEMLLDELKPTDTVAIVTYAGNSKIALEPTLVKEKRKIKKALDELHAMGSTAGAEGIRKAYELAEQNFDKNAINRVIIGTDGDFNVGITDPQQLEDFISRKRETGVYLSILSFGRGNYNDALMQKLTQAGNGNASYIDTLMEARKVLVEEFTSTLFPIANDVKIQVEFNPKRVAEYRLVGYETRMLKEEDFKNDKVDAGDIGAGHTVTAIYEITEVGSKASLLGDHRYAENKKSQTPKGNEYGFLKMRYKTPGEQSSKLLSKAITTDLEKKATTQASSNARFGVAVAGFAQLLKQSKYIHNNFDYDAAIKLAQKAKGKDAFGYRAELIQLIRLAKIAKTQKKQEDLF
ncbi:MAG: VWA domain-containing protein [Alphaproteobacteria bacterium]|nr:VWA domain-containing protein [Alphaproteobacteria bacterium]